MSASEAAKGERKDLAPLVVTLTVAATIVGMAWSIFWSLMPVHDHAIVGWSGSDWRREAFTIVLRGVIRAALLLAGVLFLNYLASKWGRVLSTRSAVLLGLLSGSVVLAVTIAAAFWFLVKRPIL